MDHPLSDPGDSDGAGAFVTPREDPPISLAVAEDTDSIDIVEEDDSRSITKSPDQTGASNVVLTKAYVSARGSQDSLRCRGTTMKTEAASPRVSLAPSVEWLDAYSEILSDPDDIMVVLEEEDEVDGVQSVEESLLTR